MKEKKLWMGFEIQTATGPVLQPTRIVCWQENQFKNHKPEAPFHFKADALVGLSLIQLNQHLQNPFATPNMNYAFASQCWLALEPHHEMSQRCQARVQALKKHVPATASKSIQNFETNFSEVLNKSLSSQGVDFGELTALIPVIDRLEKDLKQALLYNFQMEFQKKFSTTLMHLHSLLFSLRALIAMDFNAYVQDPTFEAVKVDSISDYLPKSEYVTNDAVLYYKFCKLASQMPDSVASELGHAFQSYSHNATCLIQSLPPAFLKSIGSKDLDDTLYLTQMDWLLGTDAGLLFRVREELYGLLEGYDKIFWFDLDGRSHQAAHSLSVNCEVSEKDLGADKAA